MCEPSQDEIENVKSTVAAASSDKRLMLMRTDLAFLAARVFTDTGNTLWVSGHIIGGDRKAGTSPFGHGNDEVVGMATVLRIGGQLTTASAELLVGKQSYAGAALLRQIVEIQYLAWAFEQRDKDAEKWLRSDKRSRQNFFSPAKLREASKGKFRGKDYGFHCELGGHPVPNVGILLNNDHNTAQLLLSDLLIHVSQIWTHFVGWAERNEDYSAFAKENNAQLLEKYQEWWDQDPMSKLPPVR